MSGVICTSLTGTGTVQSFLFLFSFFFFFWNIRNALRPVSEGYLSDAYSVAEVNPAFRHDDIQLGLRPRRLNKSLYLTIPYRITAKCRTLFDVVY